MARSRRRGEGGGEQGIAQLYLLALLAVPASSASGVHSHCRACGSEDVCETDSSIDGVVIVIERTRPRLVRYSSAVDFVNHVPRGCARRVLSRVIPTLMLIAHDPRVEFYERESRVRVPRREDSTRTCLTRLTLTPANAARIITKLRAVPTCEMAPNGRLTTG